MATFRPYAQHLGQDDPVAVISTTAATLETLIRRHSDVERPLAPGKWSLHQIVAHLADCEMVFQARLRWILAEDNPLLPGFDQDKWMNVWLLGKESYDETWQRFETLRAATVRTAVSASPDQLRRTGQHPEHGLITAWDVIAVIAGHDRHHLKQLSAGK